MNTQYQLVKTPEELRRAVDALSKAQVIGVDTETTDLDPYLSRLRLIQLATPDGVRLADRLAELPVDEGVRFAGPPLAV